jgi:hypothetical protein
MDLGAARDSCLPILLIPNDSWSLAWPDLAGWLRRRNALRIKGVTSQLINRNTRHSRKFERIDEPFDTPNPQPMHQSEVSMPDIPQHEP